MTASIFGKNLSFSWMRCPGGVANGGFPKIYQFLPVIDFIRIERWLLLIFGASLIA